MFETGVSAIAAKTMSSLGFLVERICGGIGMGGGVVRLRERAKCWVLSLWYRGELRLHAQKMYAFKI